MFFALDMGSLLRAVNTYVVARNQYFNIINLQRCNCNYSRTPLIRTLVIRIANNPDRLGSSSKFVENSTKLTCLEITGYRIKYNTVFMASRTSNQAWSKGLDAGTYCKQ